MNLLTYSLLMSVLLFFLPGSQSEDEQSSTPQIRQDVTYAIRVLIHSHSVNIIAAAKSTPESFSDLDRLLDEGAGNYFELSGTQQRELEKITDEVQSIKRDLFFSLVSKKNNREKYLHEIAVQEETTSRKISDILVSEQSRILKQLRKQAKLSALGWILCVQTLNSDPTTVLSSDQRKSLKELENDERAFASEEKAKLLNEIKENLETIFPNQKNLWSAEVSESLPIDLLVDQLDPRSHKELNLQDDPLAGFRYEYTIGPLSNLRFRKLNRQIAPSFIESCRNLNAAEISIQQFSEYYELHFDNPNSTLGMELTKIENERAGLLEKLRLQQDNQDSAAEQLADSFVRADRLELETFLTLLTPLQKEQVKKAIVQAEIRNMGIFTSLRFGTLATIAKPNKSQLEKIEVLQTRLKDAYEKKLRQRYQERTNRLKIILNKSQFDYCKENFLVTEKNDKAIPTCELDLFPRTLYNRKQ